MSDIRLELVPSPLEASNAVATERQEVLRQFRDELIAAGIDASEVVHIRKSADAASHLLVGEFIVNALPIAETIVPILVAYIAGRSQRKVRVKIGDKEVEAGSAKEVERLFKSLVDEDRD